MCMSFSSPGKAAPSYVYRIHQTIWATILRPCDYWWCALIQLLRAEKIYKRTSPFICFPSNYAGKSVYSWGSGLFFMDLLSSAVTKGNRYSNLSRGGNVINWEMQWGISIKYAESAKYSHEKHLTMPFSAGAQLSELPNRNTAPHLTLIYLAAVRIQTVQIPEGEKVVA